MVGLGGIYFLQLRIRRIVCISLALNLKNDASAGKGTSQGVVFVDITNPRSPRPLGTVAVGGEPTSVAIRGGYAYAGVNTSPDYVNPSGKLVQIRISSRAVTGEVDLGGQPDAVAISPDGQYLAVAIENERDEDLGDGAPPQMPAGYVQIVEMATMAATKVELTGLAGLVYGTDPEPEFVAMEGDAVDRSHALARQRGEEIEL